MGRSNTLRTGWRPWLPALSLLGVSLVLLVFERAQVGRFLWDAANLSAQPGYWAVSSLQAQKTAALDFIFWRERIVSRLADLEQERQEQQLHQAELTLQLQTLQSEQAVQNLPVSGMSFVPEQWQAAQWQGFSGTWQVNLGCQHGVRVGDPVSAPRGILVGEVTEVQGVYSLVKSWDSPDWRVPARVGTSSAVAVVAAHPTGVGMESLRWPAPVQNGDVIFSAGNQTLPRGLVIGEVKDLQPHESFGEATAFVATPVPLTQLNQVFVPQREESTCQM